jgi:hypothetical protein
MNYDNKFYIALRIGKIIIHDTKGRGYNTKGFGLGIYGFTFDYKKINSKDSGLDKTWAVTFGFRTRLDQIFHF